MSSEEVIYFMYRHHQHCIIKASHARLVTSSDTFTLFSWLPKELRLKVWEAVASEPNTTELSCTPSASHIPEGRWISHSKPPILFTVCSESREVALRKYTRLAFSPNQTGAPWPRLYVNFDVDTLWLCSDVDVLQAKDLFETNEQFKMKLRRLKINEAMWKALNPVVYTPFTLSAWPWIGQENCTAGIRSVLKGLEFVSFHG